MKVKINSQLWPTQVIIVCRTEPDIHIDIEANRVLPDSSGDDELQESQTTNGINNMAEDTGASMEVLFPFMQDLL